MLKTRIKEYKEDVEKENEITLRMRRKKIIEKYAAKYEDIYWWNVHKSLKIEKPNEICIQAEKAAKIIEDGIDKSELIPEDEYDVGMIRGKLSALRWVLGEEWDNLDTQK